MAITGLGWYSSLGQDVASTWEYLCRGDTGIAPIRRWDASGYPAHVAAEILDVPAPPGMPAEQLERLRRGGRFFVAAADEAWASAGLAGCERGRIGVAVGVSISHLHHAYLQETWRTRNAAGTDVDLSKALAHADVSPLHYDRLLGNTIAAVAADRLGCGGPQVSIDTACAASMHALADACRLIWRGRADAMVVGGASGLVTPLVVVAFGRIGALSGQLAPREASRPFDARRDGFVLGEGAGAVIVERMDHARRRGARILAQVAGVGFSTNAASLTDPSPGGEAEGRTMRMALADAGLSPESIDYVAAHGTSTRKNDVTETAAIKAVFGEHARTLSVSSNKGQFGHTISSAGIFNVLAATMAITEGRVPPTATLEVPDPACDLDYVPGTAKRRVVRAALANAFAFGGQNASAVLVAPA